MPLSIMSEKVKYPVYKMNCSQFTTKSITTGITISQPCFFNVYFPSLTVERVGKTILATCSEVSLVL